MTKLKFCRETICLFVDEEYKRDIGDGDICHRKGLYGLWIVEKASVIG